MLEIIKGTQAHALDAFLRGGGNAFHAFGMDAATATGMAFLQAELEKRDTKIREPLTSVTWMRDIVAKTGGGWVDFTSIMNVDYATPGPNNLGIIGGQSTAIPVMQADISKDVFKVFNWAHILKAPYIDVMKSQTLGRSLDDILGRGITLNWNKALDYMVYRGFGSNYGLVNQTAVTRVAAANGAQGSPLWSLKTPNEILDDFNTLLNDTWTASEYDEGGMCDHILIPPAKHKDLTQPMTLAGASSIMEYILKNSIAKEHGIDLKIIASRWCTGAGQGSTDRMVGYKNDEDKLYFDIPVPINRAMTMPSVTDAAYLTLYLGQIGVVKFLYLQPAEYMDGI